MQEQNENVVVPESTEGNAPQYTDIQLKAIDQGWIPKEDFDGDESEFIDAPEFVRRGELFKKIETQSKEVKALRNAVEAMKVHHSKVKEVEYERALKTLKSARKEAFVNGEHEQAFALEEKIDELTAEKAAIVAESQVPAVKDEDTYTPEFTSWVENNPWYESNKTMRATADALGVAYHKEGYSPSEVLRMVETEIRAEFKHKFTRDTTKRSMAVEPSTREGTGNRNTFSLTPEEKKFMHAIVQTGIMTEAQYLAELKATKSR